MFPVTDNSKTIIDCLIHEANKYGVEILFSTEVKSIKQTNNLFQLATSNRQLETNLLCIACGGYSKSSQFQWIKKNFGVGGVAKYLDLISTLRDIALQSDGKIILSGSKSDLSTLQENLAAVRMNNDGSADKSFGVNGLATGDFGKVLLQVL